MRNASMSALSFTSSFDRRSHRNSRDSDEEEVEHGTPTKQGGVQVSVPTSPRSPPSANFRTPAAASSQQPTAAAAPGAVPSFLTNETGSEIRCW